MCERVREAVMALVRSGHGRASLSASVGDVPLHAAPCVSISPSLPGVPRVRPWGRASGAPAASRLSRDGRRWGRAAASVRARTTVSKPARPAMPGARREAPHGAPAPSASHRCRPACHAALCPAPWSPAPGAPRPPAGPYAGARLAPRHTRSSSPRTCTRALRSSQASSQRPARPPPARRSARP